MAARRTPGPGREAMKRTIEGYGSRRLLVGFFETAKYEDGTPVAYVAAIHEYGSPPQGIPPRPFMRPTFEAKKAEWDEQFSAGARAVARGAITPDAVMGSMGGVAAGAISEAIAAVTSPPLKEATIRDKQRAYANGTAGGTGNLSKPLVRTGLLIASPTFAVESK